MPSALPGLAPSLRNEQINNSLFKWLLLKTASRLILSISPATLRVHGIYLRISRSAKGTEEVSKDLLAATHMNCPCAGTQIEHFMSLWNQLVLLLKGFQ